MKARLAKKILRAQPEYMTKRTNPYWVGQWKVYNANMHPLNWEVKIAGMIGDHRIVNAINRMSKCTN